MFDRVKSISFSGACGSERVKTTLTYVSNNLVNGKFDLEKFKRKTTFAVEVKSFGRFASP